MIREDEVKHNLLTLPRKDDLRMLCRLRDKFPFLISIRGGDAFAGSKSLIHSFNHHVCNALQK